MEYLIENIEEILRRHNVDKPREIATEIFNDAVVPAIKFIDNANDRIRNPQDY